MYLLDTNALSEPLKARPHAAFIEQLSRVPADGLFTSTICVMELRYGCVRRRDPKLWDRIRAELLVHVQVLPFGDDEATIAGELLAALQTVGRPVGVEDVQIAATALVRALTVVTANEAHFTRVPNLRVVNWMR
jgi:tRNA(fMet)-specific endonuclease VapC